MNRFLIFLLFIVCTHFSHSQIRNGWRSIYDTSGRLSRMSYYDRGISVIDSNFYFQYHTDNLLKAIVTGEITKEDGCKNGAVILFDETANVTSYSIRRSGQQVFLTSCDYQGLCNSNWGDPFDVKTNIWIAENYEIENGELILNNEKNSAFALFNSPVAIDLKGEFVIQTRIPNNNNSQRLGIVFGYQDDNNYYILEISNNDFFSLLNIDNGNAITIGDGRKPIEKKGLEFNELKINCNGRTIIIEINKNIELIFPKPNFKGNTIGLATRSRGAARFLDFGFSFPIPNHHPFYSNQWIGKGTGFFISPQGRILTTYDAIFDAKKIRVKVMINDQVFTYNAELMRVEEDRNLAILQISDHTFKPINEIPFGLTGKKPISESNCLSIGYPNAVSGIFMKPEIFSGKILPTSVSASTDMLLEMSFRYGMIGSPVFDNDANLIGIVSNKGLELKYTEAIDYFNNSRLLQGFLGRSERSFESPLKGKTVQEKYKALSEIVVIIESSIFGAENTGEN
jgi:hypothetical protein